MRDWNWAIGGWSNDLCRITAENQSNPSTLVLTNIALNLILVQKYIEYENDQPMLTEQPNNELTNKTFILTRPGLSTI